MKQTFKKAMSISLAVVMIFGTAFCMKNFIAKAEAATITSYSVGDIIEFGRYPQSEVTDSSIISALNSLAGDNENWPSYGYYSGTGEYFDGQMTASDYMRYKDVIYGSDKYRGVVFDSYRPSCTRYTLSSSNTHQDDNGYTTGTVYWFKYEPIEWRVLDPSTGMVMAETILDSQAYNNYTLRSDSDEDEYGHTAYWGDSSKTYYANNYAKSSIREWLNDNFYNTAFSASQQNIIEYTELDNSAYSHSFSAYDSETTYDKIYLLSYADVLNTNYGFSSSYDSSDAARRAQGSDYAKCQGLYVYTGSSSIYSSGNSYWRLRSSGSYSYHACYVDSNGCVNRSYYTDYINNGVRPVLNLSLSSEIIQPETSETEPTTKAEKTTVLSTEKPSVTNTTTEITEATTKAEVTTKPDTEVTTEAEVTTKPAIEDKLIMKPSTSTVNYGETLILHADFTNIPADAKIEWSIEGEGVTINPSEDGKTCAVTSTATGDATITAKYVDANGVEHVSEQEIESNASIWQKIVSFFKNLFGISRIIEQRIRF